MPLPIFSFLRVAGALIQGKFTAARPRSASLPFNAAPPIRSYLYAANNTGILTANGSFWSELAPLYIQVFFPYAKLISPAQTHRFDFFPQFVTSNYAALGYITTDHWERESFMAARDRFLIERIATALANDRYVLCTLNEFYLPGSGAFLRTDFRHTCLIIGYSSERHAFVVVGYAADGSFGLREIPAGLIAQGIKSTRRSRKGTYPAEPVVIEVQRAAKPPRPPGAASILRSLQCYLAGDSDGLLYTANLVGEDQTAHFERVGRFTANPGEFGTKVYPLIQLYLNLASDKWGELDLRATRIVHEHKLVLRQVLRRLGDLGATMDRSSSFDRVVAMAHEFHLTCFAYSKERKQSTISRASALLHEMEAAERTILEKTLKEGVAARTAHGPVTVAERLNGRS